MSSDTLEVLWSVYVIRCADGSLYAGISTDVARRMSEHRDDAGKGAKFLRGKGPLELVCSQAVGNRSRALKVEHRFRKLSKGQKESLLAGAGQLEVLLTGSPG